MMVKNSEEVLLELIHIKLMVQQTKKYENLIIFFKKKSLKSSNIFFKRIGIKITPGQNINNIKIE